MKAVALLKEANTISKREMISCRYIGLIYKIHEYSSDPSYYTPEIEQKIKDEIIEYFGWCLYDAISMSDIAVYMFNKKLYDKKMLSINSGFGLFNEILKYTMENVYKFPKLNLISTDIENLSCLETFTDVEQLSAEDAVKKYNDSEVLLTCWPNFYYLTHCNYGECIKCNENKKLKIVTLNCLNTCVVNVGILLITTTRKIILIILLNYLKVQL